MVVEEYVVILFRGPVWAERLCVLASGHCAGLWCQMCREGQSLMREGRRGCEWEWGWYLLPLVGVTVGGYRGLLSHGQEGLFGPK